ncbi:MAG: hypothetical protein GY851_31725, partial [bacterium]|nr:hypothetical protein [bacterium]
EEVELKDARPESPLKNDAATYMMGMGRRGGYRPETWDWKWDVEKHQDSVWLGDVDGGVQCKLMGPDYERPFVNINYHYKPLRLPKAWYNDGKGGCTIREEGDTVVLRAYSGERRLAKGAQLQFVFRLLLTPFKTLSPEHWNQRYFHNGVPQPDVVKSTDANLVNIHHANGSNPYINYPFLRTDELTAYIKTAHENDLKVKLYYTVRELTNHVVELWALRSLGDEILINGPGGGSSWLQEHLVSDYVRAWECHLGPGDVCAAVVTNGMSRWHNYYVEGLAWLIENTAMDGLYIDDVAYDRDVMKRARKILDRERPGSLIDVHSWNHFNARAGFAVCANLYLEHFPYIDSIWFGEG